MPKGFLFDKYHNETTFISNAKYLKVNEEHSSKAQQILNNLGIDFVPGLDTVYALAFGGFYTLEDVRYKLKDLYADVQRYLILKANLMDAEAKLGKDTEE